MNFCLKFKGLKIRQKIKSDDKTLIEIYLRVAQNNKMEKALETLKIMYGVLEKSKKIKHQTLNEIKFCLRFD